MAVAVFGSNFLTCAGQPNGHDYSKHQMPDRLRDLWRHALKFACNTPDYMSIFPHLKAMYFYTYVEFKLSNITNANIRYYLGTHVVENVELPFQMKFKDEVRYVYLDI